MDSCQHGGGDCQLSGSPGAPQLVAKLWSFCHVLRDDGHSYLDYTEQLTFLLFLKMADEREKLGQPGPEIPAQYPGSRLAADDMEGEKLETHYRDTLAAPARVRLRRTS